MEIKNEKNTDLELREKQKDAGKTSQFAVWIKSLFKKKLAVWIILATAIFIAGTAYILFSFIETERGSFSGKILKPFLAEDLPFVERNSFFFPVSREEKLISEEKEAGTVLNETSKRAKSNEDSKGTHQ